MLIVNTHAHARNAIAYLAPLGIPPRSLALRAPGGSAPAPLRGAPPAKPPPRQVARARSHPRQPLKGWHPGKPESRGKGKPVTTGKGSGKQAQKKKGRESRARLIRIKKEYVLLFLYLPFTPYNPPFPSFMVSQKYEIKQGVKINKSFSCK